MSFTPSISGTGPWAWFLSTTTASSSSSFHPTWTQLPYHQAPPATNLPTYSIPISTLPYRTLSRQASTLLPHSFILSRRRRAAPRLVPILFFPLSLFFFFASVLLYTVHALASRSVLSLVVLCRIASSLPPTCSFRRLFLSQSELRGLIVGLSREHQNILDLDLSSTDIISQPSVEQFAHPRQLTLDVVIALCRRRLLSAGADADRCTHSSTFAGSLVPIGHSPLVDLERGVGIVYLVRDYFSPCRRATTTPCSANIAMATTLTNIMPRTCPRMLIQTGSRTANTEPGPLTAAIDRDLPFRPRVRPIRRDGLRTNRPAKALSGTGREGGMEGLQAARRGHARPAVSP